MHISWRLHYILQQVGEAYYSHQTSEAIKTTTALGLGDWPWMGVLYILEFLVSFKSSQSLTCNIACTVDFGTIIGPRIVVTISGLQAVRFFSGTSRGIQSWWWLQVSNLRVFSHPFSPWWIHDNWRSCVLLPSIQRTPLCLVALIITGLQKSTSSNTDELIASILHNPWHLRTLAAVLRYAVRYPHLLPEKSKLKGQLR